MMSSVLGPFVNAREPSTSSPRNEHQLHLCGVGRSDSLKLVCLWSRGAFTSTFDPANLTHWVNRTFIDFPESNKEDRLLFVNKVGADFDEDMMFCQQP